MWYEIWKGKKKFAKRRIRIRVDHVKMSMTHILPSHHWSWWWAIVFYNLDQPNHALMGGVNVNSLYQQGGLFALIVNRHSVIGHLLLLTSVVKTKYEKTELTFYEVV